MSKTCERCVHSQNIDNMNCEGKDVWEWMWCNKKEIFIQHKLGVFGSETCFYLRAKGCLSYEEEKHGNPAKNTDCVNDY